MTRSRTKSPIRTSWKILFIVTSLVLTAAICAVVFLFSRYQPPADQTEPDEDVSVASIEAAQGPSPTTDKSQSSPQSEEERDKQSGRELEINDSRLLGDGLQVTYGAYYFNSGNYFFHDSNRPSISASVIKVFIMEYAFFEVDTGRESLNTYIGYDTLENLIVSMIQVSDNEATNALIDHFGIGALNQFFQNQGYHDTVIGRRMNDILSGEAGIENYTSVDDAMSFLKKVYENQDRAPYSSMLEIMKGQTLRNKIPSQLPPDVTVASKTGEIPGVENDIAIVFSEKDPFALVILSDGVRDRGEMISAIGQFAREAYSLSLSP